MMEPAPSAAAVLDRQQWFGAKRLVKRTLGLRVPHFVMRQVALRRPGVAVARLPAPNHVRAVRARFGGAAFTMLRPDRCVIAKELWWGHGQRPGAADQRALDVFAGLARDADLVLDVGAYTGIFSLLAATVNPRCEVHAFEMVPEVYKGLLDNLAANDLLTRVQAHLAGVWSSAGDAPVPLGANGSALPDFLSLETASAATNRGGIVRVPLLALDGLGLAGRFGTGARVLVKIDVEGVEHEVLAGASTLLADLRPDLLCELLPQARWQAVAAALPAGYRALLVTDDGLVERSAPEPDPTFRDWLLTPRPDADLPHSHPN